MSKYGIMLDLETCGTQVTSAIVSIGATLLNFDTLTIDDYFYTSIYMDSSKNAGMTVDPRTMLWWEAQSDEAKAVFTDPDRMSLSLALFKFSDFIGDKDESILVYGNGASFDNAILGHAFDLLNMKLPWQFYNNRCYRTIKAMCKDVPRTSPRIAHDALSDAIAQSHTLFDILRSYPERSEFIKK